MADYTISELQKMLEERQTRLKTLAELRSKKLAELKEIDTQIETLSGEAVSDSISTVTLPKPQPKKKRVPRDTNKQTSVEYAKEILAKHPLGLELNDLAEAVLKAGYSSKSSNFSNSLYQALYKSDEIVRNSEGRYVLT